ncbi:hypothetical protein CN316_26145 [Bacillus cereus]|nr:hypothetical protein CN316_26145 [Bacillus cereus]
MSVKLRSLYIRNFRNIKNFLVDDMKDINLFIGKNNIGKSNYLRAIRCFFKALESSNIYIEGVIDKDDIMSGTEDTEEDLLLVGLLEEADTRYIVCIGCLQIDEEIYTYHYISRKHGLDPSRFAESLRDYEYRFEEYGQHVKEFLKKIGRVKRFNGLMETYRNDYEYVASLTMDLKMEETINVHKYIENNLNLSDRTMAILKRGNINRDNIQGDIISRLKVIEKNYSERIKDVFKELNDLERPIKDAWEGIARIPISRAVYFHNENLSIPKVMTGIKTMFIAERKEIVTSEDAQKLFSLKNKKEYSDTWLNFRNMCRRVLDIEIDVFLNSENIPTIDISNNWINLNGTGIREVFRIILDIEFLNPEIILIEEPEIHLHFELQQRLSEYLQLKAKHAQIFITSHSTAFVEETHDKSVYLIKRKEEKENSIQLLDSESLDEVIGELGYNAQALLIKKMLIFVEGKTDKMIVDTYLQKFYPHMLSKIGCIDMKGETKYKYFANAESLEIFEKSGVETFFILDSDYKTLDEKERKISQHPEKSNLVFWPGVCIENLFLNPVVLDKFITAKDEAKKKRLDEIEEIKKKTYADIKIESSRKYIREKHLKAIYPEKHSKDSITDIDALKTWFNEKRTKMREELELEVDIDSIVAEFDALWESNLDEVVPGDKFLIKFCENIGNLTYKKNEKNVRYLIDDLSQEEWPIDFTQIMEGIIQKANNRVLESV